MKKPFLILLLVSIGIFGLLHFAIADNITLPNPLCPGNNPGGAGCISTFSELITKITDYVTTIIGVLAVLMYIIAGILFVISAGSEERIGRAKKIAIWATIGLGIALVGKGLIEIVSKVLGVNPPAPP